MAARQRVKQRNNLIGAQQVAVLEEDLLDRVDQQELHHTLATHAAEAQQVLALRLLALHR